MQNSENKRHTCRNTENVNKDKDFFYLFSDLIGDYSAIRWLKSCARKEKVYESFQSEPDISFHWRTLVWTDVPY